MCSCFFTHTGKDKDTHTLRLSLESSPTGGVCLELRSLMIVDIIKWPLSCFIQPVSTWPELYQSQKYSVSHYKSNISKNWCGICSSSRFKIRSVWCFHEKTLISAFLKVTDCIGPLLLQTKSVTYSSTKERRCWLRLQPTIVSLMNKCTKSSIN